MLEKSFLWINPLSDLFNEPWISAPPAADGASNYGLNMVIGSFIIVLVILAAVIIRRPKS